MKAKHIIILASLLLMGSAANAQIFILEDDEFMDNNRAGAIVGGSLPTLPMQDFTTDQFAPPGSGMLVLSALGGAYLLGRRRKSQD